MKIEERTVLQTVNYLKDNGWLTYREVRVSSHKSICDIVAIKEEKSWFVECKPHIGIGVIEQAYKWIGGGNYVSISTPDEPSELVRSILGLHGIGAIVCGSNGKTVESVMASFYEDANRDIFRILEKVSNGKNKNTFFPISRATVAEHELVRLAIEKHGGNVANFYVEMAKKYLKGEFK